ncbi:hypothetical protein GQ457_07G009900 [Hibiscus cannabinus]
MVTFWVTWYTRNKVILEGVVPSVCATLSFVEAYIRENGRIKAPLYLMTRSVDRVSWQTPVENVIKLNFAAAYDAQSNKSFSGVICRDSARLIMASCTSPQSHVADAFMDEALACLQAVNCACDLGFSRVIVEGDSLTVIKKVCSKTATVSLFSPVIYDIREVAKGSKDVTFCFTHREANSTAHALACEGKMFSCPMYWIEEAPPNATLAAEINRVKLDNVQQFVGGT